MSSHEQQDPADHFLEIASQFQLGELPTEARHPLTSDLSELALKNLPVAIDRFKQVEIDSLTSLKSKARALGQLRSSIDSAISQGRKVFLVGCGATGRLSLSLETLWREINAENPEKVDRVVSFMAGGDYALVRSIENFEDHPEYGERQLTDLGFQDGDLLIATTEGGETPFVIGACEAAARISKRRPWFLFCNPVEALKQKLERSRRVLNNPGIISHAFETGPMAISGSTRLQASTVLMLAVGAAMFSRTDAEIPQLINDHAKNLQDADFTKLKSIIEQESAAYAAGKTSVYVIAGNSFSDAITVLTDTTERSPTFSLRPFENIDLDDGKTASWTYLALDKVKDSNEAWRTILRREPRALDWSEFKERFGEAVLSGFDFSAASIQRRKKLKNHGIEIRIEGKGGKTIFTIDKKSVELVRPPHPLLAQLHLKCALNIISSLVMGRVGRFRGNVMLFVRASNNKLVDRSIRYVQALFIDTEKQPPSY
ncbi:MAG TPA: hypothetical protein VM432_10445, partial [Bdellovibrionales bacterium]|nr:hypothetical protein [Bdellovibrionales bacterium]